MKRIGLIILILLIAFLLYWFLMRKTGEKKEMSEEDRQALIEDTAKSDESQPRDSIVVPNTPLGDQLKNHMMILAMPAPTIEEADAKYQASLNELKKNSAEAVKLLGEAYKKTEHRHYFNRWGIVKTLGDIGDKSAFPILSEILLSKIPAETSKDLHHFSSQEEEVIIRIRAIEGLGIMAKAGDKSADSLLFRLSLDSTITNSAIRTRAIKSFISAGKNNDERIKLLRSRVDKNLQDIVTLSVTSPDEFSNKMEEIKRLSGDSTRSESYDKPRSITPAPKIKNN